MTGIYQLNWYSTAKGWHPRLYGEPPRPATRHPATPFDRQWFWRTVLPHRKGQPCRVTARGRMNSIEVQFEDGTKVITHRYAVRKPRP